ncbi:MAG: hypothetical protein WD844_12710 [Thermoleophilaceae bacterium]
MGRKESVEKGARKHGLLEDGESIQEAIVVNGGKLVGLGLDAVWTKRFALAATETNFYVLEMGQVGFKSVKGVVTKMPLGEVEFDKSFAEFKVARRGHPEEGAASFQLALLVSAKKLTEYVESRRAG